MEISNKGPYLACRAPRQSINSQIELVRMFSRNYAKTRGTSNAIVSFDQCSQNMEVICGAGVLANAKYAADTPSQLLAKVLYDGVSIMVSALSQFAPSTMMERMEKSGGTRALDDVMVDIIQILPDGGCEKHRLLQPLVLRLLPEALYENFPGTPMQGSVLLVPIPASCPGRPAKGFVVEYSSLKGFTPSNIFSAQRSAQALSKQLDKYPKETFS